MTRTVTSAVNTEMTAAELSPFFAVEMDFSDGIVRLWTGYGSITIDSKSFLAGGDILSVSSISESAEVQANGVTIKLSGLSTSLVASALTTAYQGRDCNVYVGVLDSNGAVVADPIKIFAGKMDVMTVEDTGASAEITVTAESKLIDLERSRARRYTSEDQKIDFPDDKGLDFIAGLQDKLVVWGR
tara:strand:- start:3050 stop:3607 length:558 start_codon:yes stop_codon:yes gene_type:complete